MGHYITNTAPAEWKERAVFEANVITGLKIEIEKKPMPIGEEYGSPEFDYSPRNCVGYWSFWNPHTGIDMTDWWDAYDLHKPR